MRRGAFVPPAASVAAAQARLEDTGRRAARVARRGRRLSLFAWLALFAIGLGSVLLALLIVIVPVTTVTSGPTGTMSDTTVPAWGPAVALAPAIALLFVALREIVVGRREALEERPVPASAPSVFEAGPPTWVGGVREVQEVLAKTATSVEWSFVPFALGVISVIIYLLSEYATFLGSAGDYGVLLVPALGLLASLVPLWLTYRAAKEWMRACQGDLEREVDEMSRLEAEFLWRFAGSGP